MSLRVKTEDGDLIVSGKGKDGKDGKDGIPVPQTAEVGQVLAVKAVDSQGKPTEWETVDKGGGGSESGRVVKTYDISEGTRIPMQKNVKYPCHMYWSSTATSLIFGAYASIDDSHMYVSYLYASAIGSGATIRSSSATYSGTYDNTTGMFTFTSSYPDYKIMI